MVSYKTNKQTEVHFADTNSALLFKRAQRCIGLYCVTSTRINQYLFNHKWWMSLLSLLPAQTTSGTISHPSYLEPRFRFFFLFFLVLPREKSVLSSPESSKFKHFLLPSHMDYVFRLTSLCTCPYFLSSLPAWPNRAWPSFGGDPAIDDATGPLRV